MPYKNLPLFQSAILPLACFFRSGLNKPVQYIFIHFLLPAGLFWFTHRQSMASQRFQTKFTFLKFLSFTRIKGSITILSQVIVRRIFEDIMRNNQASGKSVHASDMGMKQILRVGGVPSQLGIKIHASIPQAPTTKDDQEGFCQFLKVDGKLVCIPTVLIISPVGIDTSKQSRINGHLKLVLKGMSCQRRMVHLQV